MNFTLDSIKDVQLYQASNGYRFSIDSVLLSEFVKKIKPSHIIDIGSGNGIIGILLAKKYQSAQVLLIEIQDTLYRLSKKNIKLNNLQGRATAYNLDINTIDGVKDISPHSFDIVVSNPPFRKVDTGRISPHREKAIARHEILLDLEKLMKGINYLLKPKGSLYLIFHPSRIIELFEGMRQLKIEPKRVRFVHPYHNEEAKMVLIEGVKYARPSLKIEKPLFVYNRSHRYSDEVQKILKEEATPP